MVNTHNFLFIMSIIIRDLSYAHPDKEILFRHLNLTINRGEKIALTGNNGCGKSTLMRIVAGELSPSDGTIHRPEHLYYVPQHFGQYDGLTVAQALGIDRKLEALYGILNGDASEEHFATLADDWTLEERIHAALATWGMDGTPLTRPLDGLSGGEKTRLFLAGMELHVPDAILLDEPTNGLDTMGRERLYEFVKRTPAALLVVSHDRTLLNLLPAIGELSANGLILYGGNYDFFKEQKSIRLNALQEQLEEKQKALRLARKAARDIAEQKAKQNVRGEKASIKKGVPRIMMGVLKDKAESSTSRLKSAQDEKAGKLQQEMQSIRNALPLAEKLKTDFNAPTLHEGKTLVTATELNFRYPDAKHFLWKRPLSFQLRSGDRICIEGNNGSGKTTLLKLICGMSPTECCMLSATNRTPFAADSTSSVTEVSSAAEVSSATEASFATEVSFATGISSTLPVLTGNLERADFSFVYLDQEYSLIRNSLSILEQAELFNRRLLPEHELKTILNRYLFPATVWRKPCSQLSGGEKMRLSFCCLMIADNAPDVFILDEPTNNLDIESIGIITETIRNYTGTVVAVSHDKEFLREIGTLVTHTI